MTTTHKRKRNSFMYFHVRTHSSFKVEMEGQGDQKGRKRRTFIKAFEVPHQVKCLYMVAVEWMLIFYSLTKYFIYRAIRILASMVYMHFILKSN